MMSRCMITNASTHGAGFYLSFSSLEDEVEKAQLTGYDYYPIISYLKVSELNTYQLFTQLEFPEPAIYLATNQADNSYVIIASQPMHDTIFTSQNSIQDFIKSCQVPQLDMPFFTGGLVGFWSYDYGLLQANLLTHKAEYPLEYFFMPQEIIVYDKKLGILTTIMWLDTKDIHDFTLPLISKRIAFIEKIATYTNNAPTNNLNSLDTSSFSCNISDNDFSKLVEKAKEKIKLGELYQVVLSRRYEKESLAEPMAVFEKLCHINYSPYNFFLKLADFTLLGASPESQIKVKNNRVTVCPIAGTKAITGHKYHDLQAVQALITDEKELAEHTMLVDLSRNDLAKVSKPNTVAVEDLFNLKYFSHVVHLVSTVTSVLKEDVDSLNAFAATFPAGTLSGAPKKQALQIIQDLEPEARGLYGGSVGHISFAGDMDSCIIIRSAIYKAGKYFIQSGAGIVEDSNPMIECQETLNKAKAVMKAVLSAEEDINDSTY